MPNFYDKDLVEIIKAAKNEDLKERLLFGEIEYKSAGKRKQLSGWVSTPSADLSDEVVEADAFKPHWDKYVANSVYCWQHDRNKPIGKVVTPELSEKGVYLRDITLSDIPPVENVIWPLIQDGVLKQQSIGFLSLKGRMEGGYYRHKEVYLLESSLVTVACNPDAVIDVVKNYGNYTDIDSLVEDYYNGYIDFDHPVRKTVSMHVSGIQTPDEIRKELSTKTNVKNIQAIPLTDSMRELHKADDCDVFPPYKIQKDYDAKMELIYLGKNKLGDYVMPIGSLTEGGFKYSWEKVAVQMCRILGAKGLPLDLEERNIAINRLSHAYEMLEKTLPSVEIENTSVPIGNVKEEDLTNVKFGQGIIFNEGEDIIFSKSVLHSDLENVTNTIKNFNKRDILNKDTAQEIVKYVSAWFEIMVGVWDQEDADTINRLLEALLAGKEDTPSAYDYAAPDGDNKQTSFEEAEAIKNFLEELRAYRKEKN